MSESRQVCKIVVAGDGGVGKTSLVYRIIGKDEIVKLTPGLGIENMLVDIKEDISADVVFWDLGGQPQFRFFQGSFLECANIILLVYDLNRYPSLSHLENEWLPMVSSDKMFETGIKILIGNKSDLGQSINDDAIDEFASKHDFHSIKVSAKEGTNVDDLVKLIVNYVHSCYDID